MEEVQLWRVRTNSSVAPRIERVESVDAVSAEKLLEDVLARSPDVLMEGLTIVGRQNETDGGPLDLLGIDDEGRLVVFELKRGALTRDAVAQVLDYASSLSEMSPDQLGEHISEMSGRYGTDKIESFADWYRENFDGKTIVDIGRPRMVLVGLGADDTTKRMVEFLAASDLDITLITFYGFTENGETLLARQVEVEAKATKQTNAYRAKKAENEEKFGLRLQEWKLETFYKRIKDALASALTSGFLHPNASGHTLYLQEQTDAGTPTVRAYLGLNVSDALGKARKVRLTLQPRMANALSEEALATLSKALKSKVAVQKLPSGFVQIDIDGTLPPLEVEAGIRAAGENAVRIWEEKQNSITSAPAAPSA